MVIALDTGPEVIAGSTRLKAGTATKMALNAMSTTAFVLLGKTYGGLMVDVRPTNAKLWARAVRIVRALSGLDEAAARRLIKKAGGRAKVALVMHHAGVNAARAKELLVQHKGSLRAIVGDVAAGAGRRREPRRTTRAPTTGRDDRRSARAGCSALRERPRRLVIGLLSGTSADGTDAALCEIAGSGENTGLVARAFVTTPFPRPLRERIYRPGAGRRGRAVDLDVLLGEAFADAALAVCRRGRRRAWPTSTSSARTARPPSTTRARRGSLGATLQIGEAAVIAERTGCPVISDFRVRDVAAGGEGAPLVPLVDHLLFRKPGRRRALQNIGGIANVTLVSDAPGRSGRLRQRPRQHAARRGGARGLARAARPSIATARAPRAARSTRACWPSCTATPTWPSRRPSRPAARPSAGTSSTRCSPATSTARRSAGDADPLLRRGDRPQLPRAPARAARRGLHLGRRRAEPDADAPPGGAAARRFRVATSAALGVDPEAKEAIAFAVLANETLFGPPGNIPAVTGASGPRVLGQDLVLRSDSEGLVSAADAGVSIATSSTQAVKPGGAVW